MNCEILLRHRNHKKTHIAAVMLDFLMLSLLMCSRLLTLAQGFCSGAVRGDVTECRLRGSAASEKGGRRPASQPQVLCLSPFDGCRTRGRACIMHFAGSRLNCNELFSARRPLRQRVRQCVWQIRWGAYCLGWLPLTEALVAGLCGYRLLRVCR